VSKPAEQLGDLVDLPPREWDDQGGGTRLEVCGAL